MLLRLAHCLCFSLGRKGVEDKGGKGSQDSKISILFKTREFRGKAAEIVNLLFWRCIEFMVHGHP